MTVAIPTIEGSIATVNIASELASGTIKDGMAGRTNHEKRRVGQQNIG
jgi:hypothetical protein